MWQYNNNELMHYGVMGMKRGKRRGPSAGSTIRKAKKSTTRYQNSKYIKNVTTSGKNKTWDKDDQKYHEKLNKERQSARKDLKKLSASGNKKAEKALQKIDKKMVNDPTGEIAASQEMGKALVVGTLVGAVGGMAILALTPSN